MRRVVTLWALAALLLLLAGVAARWLPRAWCPDLGLLLAVAAGLYLPGLAGCAAAWGIGWTTDLLSGSALGEYAALRLLAWGATRLVDRQLHLRRPLLLMGFVACLTVAEAALLAGFGPGFDAVRMPAPAWLGALAPHALVNALAAPLVGALAAHVLGWVGAPTGPRGPLRLPARSPLS